MGSDWQARIGTGRSKNHPGWGATEKPSLLPYFFPFTSQLSLQPISSPSGSLPQVLTNILFSALPIPSLSHPWHSIRHSVLPYYINKPHLTDLAAICLHVESTRYLFNWIQFSSHCRLLSFKNPSIITLVLNLPGIAFGKVGIYRIENNLVCVYIHHTFGVQVDFCRLKKEKQKMSHFWSNVCQKKHLTKKKKKIQHSFRTETLNKLEIDRNFLNWPDKGHLKNLQLTSHLMVKDWTAYLLTSEIRQGYLHLKHNILDQLYTNWKKRRR